MCFHIQIHVHFFNCISIDKSALKKSFENFNFLSEPSIINFEYVYNKFLCNKLWALKKCASVTGLYCCHVKLFRNLRI